MTAVPSVTAGRGAFTVTGKDNGSRYYRYIQGRPPDGSRPTKDVNYQAVNLGVKALHVRTSEFLAWFGGPPQDVHSGIFGPLTGASVKWVQGKLGLDADGIVGPATCKEYWRGLVGWYADIHHVPAEHLWGMMHLESAFDPGAVGYTTPSDRGLCQINLVAHPSVTVEQAFDPAYAINYSAERLARARRQFSGKDSPDLQRDCSILQHNSPLAAKTLYEVGSIGADEKGAIYIALVLKHAASY